MYLRTKCLTMKVLILGGLLDERAASISRSSPRI